MTFNSGPRTPWVSTSCWKNRRCPSPNSTSADRRSRWRTRSSVSVCGGDTELILHVFERDALCFGIHEQDDKELNHHHRREEYERRGAVNCDDRERVGDAGVHDPMREAAEALPLCTHAVP